jgi:SAM-dependent methyltransferase
MSDPRRDTFLRGATDYAAVRPAYPAELFDAAIQLGALAPGASVLEIGCGTGLATRSLAERGFRVLAADRSAEMLKVARDYLQSFPQVEFRQLDFEQLEPSPQYDAVLFAGSFHWLDPLTRAARAASHLKPGGSLIILSHSHPVPFTAFFERVQRVYERLVPEWAPLPSPTEAEERVQALLDEIARSGLYSVTERRTVVWTRSYSRAEFERLLGTYSDHAALPPERRNEVIHSIGELIDNEFGGAIERPYRTEMLLARRSTS